MVKKASFVYAAAILFFALPVFAQFPNDPLFVNAPDKQWNLFKIDMPNAWNIEKGEANILIAIMDSGIDGNWNGSTFSFTHPDLAGNSNRFIAGNNFEVTHRSLIFFHTFGISHWLLARGRGRCFRERASSLKAVSVKPTTG